MNTKQQKVNENKEIKKGQEEDTESNVGRERERERERESERVFLEMDVKELVIEL